MPVVSVVMYFHRVTPFLRPAVESVLRQSFGDLELVLVDNGVGVGAEPLGESGRDPRLRIVSQPEHSGIAEGHNTAIALARGEFIALLDSDDIALPNRLEKQVAALRADERLGLVSSCADQINEDGTVIGREFALVGAEEQRVFSGYTNPAPAPSYTGRAVVFRRFPFRAQFPFACDYDFFSRAAEAWAMRGIPEVLLHYRRHAQQTTAARFDSQMISACVIRLLTARRRSGRDENLDATVRAVSEWSAPGRNLGEVYRHFAGLSLAEGFPLLAVYHARKALSVQCRPSDFRAAMAILMAAIRSENHNRARLLRMFRGGPLRAHGLRRA